MTYNGGMNTPHETHRFYIYAYIDVRPSREGEVIYVGKGTYTKRNKFARLDSHWKSGVDHKNRLFANVLQKIRALGLEPIRKVISWHATEADAFSAEMENISLYRLRKHGGTLCNLTVGGEGPNGMIHRQDTKEKIGQASKNNWADPAYAAKKSTSLRATLAQPDAKQRRAQASVTNWANPEFKAKTSAAIKAAKSDPAFKAKLSETCKALWVDPAARQAQSEKMKAVLADPEAKARKSAAMKKMWAEKRELLLSFRKKTA